MVKAEAFVEMNGGMIFGSHRQGEFAVLHGPQSFGGSLHQDAAQSMALKSRLHAELRSVAHAGRNFAGQGRANKFITSRMTNYKRSAREKLAAAGKQHNIFEEA